MHNYYYTWTACTVWAIYTNDHSATSQKRLVYVLVVLVLLLQYSCSRRDELLLERRGQHLTALRNATRYRSLATTTTRTPRRRLTARACRATRSPWWPVTTTTSSKPASCAATIDRSKRLTPPIRARGFAPALEWRRDPTPAASTTSEQHCMPR